MRVSPLFVFLSVYGSVAVQGQRGEETVTTTTTTTTEEDVSPVQDTTAEDNTTTTEKQEEEPKTKPTAKKYKTASDFDVENEDWGSYYDPQNVFCGDYDCYKILGFDYESFGKVKPSTKEITKRYRQLSREWHPDKSKHKNAKARFVKIARAYEVLTDKEQRAEYDMMRYNQDAYFHKHGTSVLWSYAPKSDVSIVIILLFIIGNVFSWYSQKHRWQLVADRLIKAAVEDWSPREGGSPESKHLREEALAVLAEREAQGGANGSTDTTTTAAASSSPSSASTKAKKKVSSKGSNKKVSGKERKRQEQEALLPVVTELVNDMHDFGGGFHKPTSNDLLVVTLAKMPYKITAGVAWQTKYLFRRLQKKELNEEEREVLTSRAVGPVAWSTSSEEDRQAMVKRELWKKDNLYEWLEEQEVKNLSAADQKYYNKMKKKGKLDKLEKLE